MASEQPIPPEALEAAIVAMIEPYGSGRCDLDTLAAEACIRAADKKRGIAIEYASFSTTEEKARWRSPWVKVPRGTRDV